MDCVTVDCGTGAAVSEPASAEHMADLAAAQAAWNAARDDRSREQAEHVATLRRAAAGEELTQATLAHAIGRLLGLA